MAKLRAWISDKLRSRKKKVVLNAPPQSHDNTQLINTSASVQAQILSPVYPATQNLSKESIPARLPIPEDTVQDAVCNPNVDAKQALKRSTNVIENRAQEAIREHKNDAENALKWAVHASDHDVVSNLLSMPRLASIKIATYQDCLIYADYHSAAICKLLITHACQDSKVYSHILDLEFFTAIIESRWGILGYLLEHADQSNKQLLLQSAVKFNRNKTARWLLQNGASAASKGAEGKVHPILPLAVERCELEMVKLLVDHGADIEAKLVSYSLHGYNALLAAADRGFMSKLKYLLDCGADIEAVDGFGRTPLHLAAKNNHIEMVRFLLDRGASHVAKSNAGKQPIHLAGDCGHAKVFNMLREHAGLAPVVGSVHYPHRNSYNSNASRSMTSPSHRSHTSLWPDQVVKDQKTGERYVLSAADPAYWN